jgi:hypothetical protein
VSSPSTHPDHLILFDPSSYPFCDITRHRSHRPDSVPISVLTQPAQSPDALPPLSTSSGSTTSRQFKEASVTVGLPSPSDSKTPSEVGDSSQALTATSPAIPLHTSPRPTDGSPQGAAVAALQDIPPAAAFSHPLEGTTQRNIVAPWAKPDGETLPIASTPVPTPTVGPVPAPTPT